MAATAPGTDKVQVDLTFNAGITGYAQVARVQASAQGANSAVIPDFTLSYGTGTVLDANGAVNYNQLYVFQGTVTNGTTKSVNMNTGSDLDVTGVALAFLTLRWALVANIGTAAGAAPDGIQKFKVGPQGIANAFGAAWGGVTAVVYEECYWSKQMRGPAAGWTVTASTANLWNVNVPGATDLTALIVLAGRK